MRAGVEVLMPIYTRTGDKGETGLLGGSRVPKDDARLEAIGSVDELNAALGVVLMYYNGPYLESLKETQRTLFSIGSQLASLKPLRIKGLGPAAVSRMEQEMDEVETQMPPLRRFILPGGAKTAALLHLARTICRRAERRIVALDHHEKVNPDIIIYINRLSDWLFILARQENARAKTKEEEWVP